MAEGVSLQNPSREIQGRRIDALEQRVASSEQANKNLLEQLTRFQQDVKIELKKQEHAVMEERQQRQRMTTAMQQQQAKITELDDRCRRAEDLIKQNKNSLNHLDNHSKSVEKYITVGQADLQAKKSQQQSRLDELTEKVAALEAGRDSTEKINQTVRQEVSEMSSRVDGVQIDLKDLQGAFKLQNKMFDSQTQLLKQNETRATTGIRMNEMQKSAVDGKIVQLQQAVIDVTSKLNHEIKDREVDETHINKRVSELSKEVVDIQRRREKDLEDLQSATKQMSNLSDAEKQKIIVQISSVQTEIKSTLEARDVKLKKLLVQRIEDLESGLSQEVKVRQDHEKEVRAQLENQGAQTKLYLDENADTIRTLLGSDQDTLRNRITEVTDSVNAIEIDISELKLATRDELDRVEEGAIGREKVIEAKMEDMNDRLRLGMNKLQVAVGENRVPQQPSGSAEDSDKSGYAEDLEGIREQTTHKYNQLSSQISELKRELGGQKELLGNRLKAHQHEGETASNILGDKLQQKMDAITFALERMKRKLDDLQEKVQGAPTDIVDVKERLDDLEKDFKRGGTSGSAGQDDLDSLRKDVDYIMGRNHSKNLVSGTPSLSQLQKDLDQVERHVKGLDEDVEKLKKQMKQEKQERVDANDAFKKEMSHLDGKTNSLKEKIKA